MKNLIGLLIFTLLISQSVLLSLAQASVAHERAGTPAHSQAVLKPIASLKLGDKVLAKSEWKAQRENLSYEPITDILVTPVQSRRLVDLVLADGQKITTTDGPRSTRRMAGAMPFC